MQVAYQQTCHITTRPDVSWLFVLLCASLPYGGLRGMPSLQMRLARHLQVGRRDDCYRGGCRLASAAPILHVRMQLGAATSTMAAFVDCDCTSKAAQGNTLLSNAPHSCSHNQHEMFACHVAASSSTLSHLLGCPARLARFPASMLQQRASCWCHCQCCCQPDSPVQAVTPAAWPAACCMPGSALICDLPGMQERPLVQKHKGGQACNSRGCPGVRVTLLACSIDM